MVGGRQGPGSGQAAAGSLAGQRQRVSGPLVPAEQLHQPELPAPVPRGPAHQAAASGLHHPHPAVDLRAVLQGEPPARPPTAAGAPRAPRWRLPSAAEPGAQLGRLRQPPWPDLAASGVDPGSADACGPAPGHGLGLKPRVSPQALPYVCLLIAMLFFIYAIIGMQVGAAGHGAWGPVPGPAGRCSRPLDGSDGRLALSGRFRVSSAHALGAGPAHAEQGTSRCSAVPGPSALGTHWPSSHRSRGSVGGTTPCPALPCRSVRPSTTSAPRAAVGWGGPAHGLLFPSGVREHRPGRRLQHQQTQQLPDVSTGLDAAVQVCCLGGGPRLV